VKGVIKNFYYEETDTSGTVEFTWDEASQTEVVLTKLEVSQEVEKTLSIVDNPVVGTAYKFGLFSTAKNATYYAAGGMSGYYMATTTSSAAAIDVYLEAATGGYYLYTMEGSTKKYLNIQPNAAGTHINAVYRDTPDMVFVYDSEKKTLVTSKELTKGDKSDKYVFGTYDNYVTIGASGASHDDTYYCRFYK
ncbi:MAG: hypothetical protein IJY79_02615, partial [Clostridia bacterium]|nr:hypothetical protein [Clostridia bacterium]